jgi:preprotein translocase subunit YajC
MTEFKPGDAVLTPSGHTGKITMIRAGLATVRLATGKRAGLTLRVRVTRLRHL